MKALIGALIAVTVTVLASTSFAFEEEHYACTSLSGQTQLKIVSVNLPDNFNFPTFDSKQADGDSVTANMTVNGKSIKGSRFQILSATDGNPFQNVYQTDGAQKCDIGYNIDGIFVTANITLNGKVRLLKFNCTEYVQRPDGAIDCN